MNKQTPITVTSPLLPCLEEYKMLLQEIWNRKWITTNGHYHQRLEIEMTKYLGVPALSLFTNGTLPLITALQALKITGEVITTPYSFVATTHALWWNGIKPIFVDVDPETGNMNPEKIEEAITPKTTAIMPVHVYGQPCNHERIEEIANMHGLKVIYDAAHAFGVKKNGESILNWGDLSTLSFHATKVYNTIEGGAMVMPNMETKQIIDDLKNFGFHDEITVVAPGINSKMDEIRAAYGLLNLQQVDAAIAARKEVAKKYVRTLKDVRGIRLFKCEKQLIEEKQDYEWNCSYFPILIDAKEYGTTRDELYMKMRAKNIFGRRYFYPLITNFEPYKAFHIEYSNNLPIAKRIANQVICLPMHHTITDEDIERIIDCIIGCEL